MPSMLSQDTELLSLMQRIIRYAHNDFPKWGSGVEPSWVSSIKKHDCATTCSGIVIQIIQVMSEVVGGVYIDTYITRLISPEEGDMWEVLFYYQYRDEGVQYDDHGVIDDDGPFLLNGSYVSTRGYFQKKQLAHLENWATMRLLGG
jgi:hypothetical protein